MSGNENFQTGISQQVSQSMPYSECEKVAKWGDQYRCVTNCQFQQTCLHRFQPAQKVCDEQMAALQILLDTVRREYDRLIGDHAHWTKWQACLGPMLAADERRGHA